MEALFKLLTMKKMQIEKGFTKEIEKYFYVPILVWPVNYFRKLLSLESEVQAQIAGIQIPAQSFTDHVTSGKLLYFFICKMG